MSDLANYVGANYVGDMKEGRYHGRGTFTYPSGVVYEGEFDNGTFHGSGRLIFIETGAVYTANWVDGVEVEGSGEYRFKDALVGPTAPGALGWQYLTPNDRRFWHERTSDMIRPGDAVARRNESDSGLDGRKHGGAAVDSVGKPLAVGDHIEARYKGKGSKFYPGKIRAVHLHPQGKPPTFDIAYDDGDHEEGAHGADIRHTDAPSAVDALGRPLAVGDHVEARYMGKGSKYFRGRVTAVHMSHGTPTFDIAYDDGDREEGALPKNVVRSDSGGGGVDASSPASPQQQQQQAQLSMQTTAAVEIAADSSGAAPPLDVDGRPLAVGEHIEARYKGKGSKFYPGKIRAVHLHPQGKPPTFDIAYDDGDHEEGAHGADIRHTGTPAATDATGKALAVGDHVEARYKGKGVKHYPGRISAVHFDSHGLPTYDIAYDDGDREAGALPANVFRTFPGSGDASSSAGAQAVGGGVGPQAEGPG